MDDANFPRTQCVISFRVLVPIEVQSFTSMSQHLQYAYPPLDLTPEYGIIHSTEDAYTHIMCHSPIIHQENVSSIHAPLDPQMHHTYINAYPIPLYWCGSPYYDNLSIKAPHIITSLILWLPIYSMPNIYSGFYSLYPIS